MTWRFLEDMSLVSTGSTAVMMRRPRRENEVRSRIMLLMGILTLAGATQNGATIHLRIHVVYNAKGLFSVVQCLAKFRTYKDSVV